jgi:hypothetical protein
MSFVQDQGAPFRRPVRRDGWLHRLFALFRRQEAQASLVAHPVADEGHVNASDSCHCSGQSDCLSKSELLAMSFWTMGM